MVNNSTKYLGHHEPTISDCFHKFADSQFSFSPRNSELPFSPGDFYLIECHSDKLLPLKANQMVKTWPNFIQ